MGGRKWEKGGGWLVMEGVAADLAATQFSVDVSKDTQIDACVWIDDTTVIPMFHISTSSWMWHRF